MIKEKFLKAAGEKQHMQRKKELVHVSICAGEASTKKEAIQTLFQKYLSLWTTE